MLPGIEEKDIHMQEQENYQPPVQESKVDTGPIPSYEGIAAKNGSSLTDEEYIEQGYEDARRGRERMKASTRYWGIPTPLEAVQAAGEWFRSAFSGNGGGREKQKRWTRTDERSRYSGEPPREKSAIERMRDTVADMDEDYKNLGERFMGFFMLFTGYVVPFAIMYGVALTIAIFFADSQGMVLARITSFALESVIAGLTIALGRAFEEIAMGKAALSKAIPAFVVWLILNASSAGILYIVFTNGGHVQNGSIDQLIVILRVVAISLADLGCSIILMFRGRSLQKHIESIRKRAAAIGELADAQRSIEEADKNAALREQMMKATLKIQDDMSRQIGQGVEMVMSSILRKMEKTLSEEEQDTGKKSGRGGSERGYTNRY
jgi:hypothetical protein